MTKLSKWHSQPCRGKLKQELIDGVLASLEVAGKALDGKDSNVTALKEAMKLYYATTKTGRYANAKEKVRRAYDCLPRNRLTSCGS